MTSSKVNLPNFFRDIEILLPPKILKTVRVEFRFSKHCYTRGLSDAELSTQTEPPINDGSIESPRYRIHDEERASLSKNLESILDFLIVNNGQVKVLQKGNFYICELIQRDGVVIEYFVFMVVKKIEELGRPKYLRVFVESAYPKKDSVPSPKSSRSIKLASLLGECWAQKRKDPN